MAGLGQSSRFQLHHLCNDISREDIAEAALGVATVEVLHKLFIPHPWLSIGIHSRHLQSNIFL